MWPTDRSPKTNKRRSPTASQRFSARGTRTKSPSLAARRCSTLHDQLLAVAGTTTDGPDLSGCGIDQHVREVEQLGSRLGVTWLGGLDVAFLRPNAERLETATRPAFKRGLAEGTIPMDSRVLDVATSTLGALRRGEALRPVTDGPFARWIPDVPAL